jgi:3'(2'), 5'-bisphosphate nucleotidase
MDSQAKYLMLASGQAELYLRSASPEFGVGYPWDHCAGQVILEEAGGKVSTWRGIPIPYPQKADQPITGLDGLAASNGQCHDEVVSLLKELA